ncbi:unnamed protein product [Rotaria sp. Silwood2]|nr:unnamed protein product [Rotaria sp. Silwood2]
MYNRLNGYRKHEDGKSACFASFSTAAVDKSERRAQAPVERTEHTRASKAVAKKHVNTEEVLSRANQFFEAEQSFLADTSKQTANENAEDEDEETEANENVTEEMVMLRQRDESQVIKYTPDSEKKTRPKITAQNLIKRIRAIGRFGTMGTVSQNMFDLFSIEITVHLLETVRFHTMFQKNFFRHRVMESKLSLAIVAAQQDRLVGGKSFDEIVDVAKDITVRRQSKYKFAQFSGQLQKLIYEFENIQCHPNLSIDIGAVKIYGVKKIDLRTDPVKVQKIIADFFSEFTKYRVGNDLLKLFNNFYDKMNQKYGPMLVDFNEKIDWTDKRSYEPYFNMLQAWLREKEKSADEKDHDDDNFVQKSIAPLRNKSALEAKFEELLGLLHDDWKYVADSIDKLHHYVKDNKELKARFGEVPNFKVDHGILNKIPGLSSSKNVSKFIEPTLNIIRFYWLSFRILTYMRHLYNCNELFAIEMGKLKHENIYVDDGNHPNFSLFMDHAQTQPLDIGNEACQLHMEQYGMSCASVRYLIAHKLDIHYQSYVRSGHHVLTKKESFNGLAASTDVLWIDNRQMYAVVVDEEYRDLVQAQVDIAHKYSKALDTEFEAESKRNYRELNAQQEFASFYGKVFRSAIIQWIEGYLALTNDQTLLRHLHHRFYVDGCHLTPFELQFILLSSTKLQTDHRCDIKFLLLLCSSVPQNELVDVLLYMQIVYHRSERFRDTKIYDAIQLIESARQKALFAVKLNAYYESIDANQIYKIILMLQHSANGFEQLEKMELYEWIDVANKQKWSEIGGLIRKYGEVGYYLGFLDDHERKNEEQMMRQIFDTVQYIPEILIAKISQFIVNNEVHADKHYFDKLRAILESGNDFSGLEIISDKRPYLITREFEQQKFINYILKRNPDKYEALLPSEQRKIDDMLNLVTGLHDVTEESKLARRHEVERIGDMVKV